MGQRELILVLGALTLFGLATLATNRYVNDQQDEMIQREYEYFGLSLAQSYVEEAKARAFDENTIGASPSVPSGLTEGGGLGPEGGEAYPNFDDVDDYRNYATTVTTPRGTFNVAIQVRYVQAAAPNTPVNSKELFKRMVVTVANDFMPNPVQTAYVFGYLKN